MLEMHSSIKIMLSLWQNFDFFFFFFLFVENIMRGNWAFEISYIFKNGRTQYLIMIRCFCIETFKVWDGCYPVVNKFIWKKAHLFSDRSVPYLYLRSDFQDIWFNWPGNYILFMIVVIVNLVGAFHIYHGFSFV